MHHREAPDKKKHLNFGFLLKGGRGRVVKTESEPFEELFEEGFPASVWTFSRKGEGVEPNPNLLRNCFQLRFGHFPRKTKLVEKILPAKNEVEKGRGSRRFCKNSFDAFLSGASYSAVPFLSLLCSHGSMSCKTAGFEEVSILNNKYMY